MVPVLSWNEDLWRVHIFVHIHVNVEYKLGSDLSCKGEIRVNALRSVSSLSLNNTGWKGALMIRPPPV